MDIRKAKKALLAGTALFCAGLAGAQGASAQSTPEPAPAPQSAAGRGSEEIVVTARKREERLVDVPVAVTALSAETIKRYGITDVKALTQNVPTLFISAVPTGSGSSVNIRGLGSLGADVGVANEVVFNVDGIPVNRGRVIGLGLLDVDRVEVLKGPQALFFGKNSPAGVVSIISADPKHEFGGFVQASYEFATVRPTLEGALDIPIGTDLSMRVAGKLSRQRGDIRNTAVPMVDPFGYAPIIQPGAVHKYQDGGNEEIGRFTLVYDPAGPFRAALKFTYDRNYANSELGTSETICGHGVTTVTLNNGFGGPDLVDPGADCKLNKRAAEGGLNPVLAPKFSLSHGGIPYSRTKTYLASMPISYDTDAFSITSVTGFYGFDTGALSNSSYSSFFFYVGSLAERYRQYSEEVRAEARITSNIKFNFGGYYEHSTDRYRSAPYFLPLGPDSRNGLINSALVDDRARTNSYSFFASLDWNITPTINLSGGARYTHDKKFTTLQDDFVNDEFFNLLGFNVLQPEGVPILAPYHGSNVSPEVTLSWHPQPDINIYGAYKTGYKSGGTSEGGALTVTTADLLHFAAEKAKGGEIGVKGILMDRKLRGDIVFYRYIYNNLQVSSLDSTKIPPTFSTTNAAKAKTQGVELQLTYQATPELSLRTNAAYNDAHYISFLGAPCTADQTKGVAPGCNGTPGSQDLSGRPLPRAPKWTVNGGFTYERPLGHLTLSFSGDATYNDHFYASDQLIPETYQNDWIKIDAGVRLSSPAGWNVAVSGRNLTDHLVQTFLFDRSGSSAQGGIYSGPTAPAREVTLSFGFNF